MAPNGEVSAVFLLCYDSKSGGSKLDVPAASDVVRVDHKCGGPHLNPITPLTGHQSFVAEWELTQCSSVSLFGSGEEKVNRPALAPATTLT